MIPVAVGAAGGLAFVWQDRVELSILTEDKWYFHCYIKSTYGDWYATFIQGPAYPTEKSRFWESMNNIGNKFKGPWKFFNPTRAKFALEFMENMRMLDLGSIGPKFSFGGAGGFPILKELNLL